MFNSLLCLSSFDTTIGPLLFEDQYIEWSTKLQSQYLYGIGEHEHRSFKHQDWNWKRWGLFARDQPPTVGLMALLLIFNLVVVHKG